MIARVILDELMVTRSIECGIERAHNYKPQYAGITDKKNYDLVRHGGSFKEFAEKQIDAVGAECAVAEYFGFEDFKPLNGTYKVKADVGQNIEVKHTYLEQGNLIITYLDRDNDFAVLVTGRCPNYQLVGWIMVKDCKNHKYRSESLIGDSYLIPRADLLPISHIKMDGNVAYERLYSL